MKRFQTLLSISTCVPCSTVKEGSAYQTETRKIILSLGKVRKVTPNGKELIRNINLGMYLGAKIGILGANGAGKSTLMKILAGVDTEFDGSFHLDDGIRAGPPHASRPRLTSTPRASHLKPHASHLAPHASRLTPRASHLKPHTSRLTPHASRQLFPFQLNLSHRLTAGNGRDVLGPALWWGTCRRSRRWTTARRSWWGGAASPQFVPVLKYPAPGFSA